MKFIASIYKISDNHPITSNEGYNTSDQNIQVIIKIVVSVLVNIKYF